MFAATVPEVDVEEDNDPDEWMEPLQQKDAEGQPSASSTAVGTTSSAAAGTASLEFSPEFYDVVFMDYIHEMMAGDNKKISKLATDLWKSINCEDNALSLN